MEIFNPILEGIADYVDWRKEVLIELYGKQDSYTDGIGYLDAGRFDLSLLPECLTCPYQLNGEWQTRASSDRRAGQPAT